MMKKVSLAIVLFCILGTITGCSTSGSYTIHDSMVDTAIRGSAVDLIVIPMDPKWTQVAIRLRGQVATQLLGAGLFKNLTDQNAEYKISIKLTEVDEVSGLSRVMWHVLAGPNKIVGDVAVIKIKTGQKVRSFSFRGESASHPRSGKADIRDAIEKAAEEIIKGLQ